MDPSLSFPRRQFLLQSSAAAAATWLTSPSALGGQTLATDPLQSYQLAWTKQIRWEQGVDISQMMGATADEKLAAAQTMLASKGGGVVYFPAGVYRFQESIRLLTGIVLRGEEPNPVKTAQDAKYALATKFEFPKYAFDPTGEGTPISQAFKGIYVAEPATAANLGLLWIDINRGHVHFQDDGTEKHAAGKNRFIVGCILRNTAVADPSIPNLKINQKGWQRFTARHHAAIDMKASENMLIANNRLPQSGDDNFTMNGYVVLDTKKKETMVDGIVFDYDNRPAIYANHYGIGGAGGMGPDGTPETHPHGFRKGTVIRDNYLFNTGRMGIGFCGDGVLCHNNVIRIPDDIWRPIATGSNLTAGSSTNDNRAIEMRGWRWKVTDNDYLIHRNWAFDKKYKINDGEGLMHEDHVNSTIVDSVLANNRGNAYLSLYKTAGIDGLQVEGNEIKVSYGAAIYVNADRNSGRFPVRRVEIVNNKLSGGGIVLSGEPAEKCVIRGNKNLGEGTLAIELKAAADVQGNTGLEVKSS